MISMLGNEAESGSKWSIEEAKEVAKKLDYDLNNKPYTLDEFRTVVIKEYYEHNIPLRRSNVALEPSAWGRMADYYFTGRNQKGKLVDDYFCMKKKHSS